MPAAASGARRRSLAALVLCLALGAACSSGDGGAPATTGSVGGEAGEAGPGALSEPVTVFESGEGITDTFRIPALTVTAEGTLLAFAENRTTSPLDKDPHGIVLRRSTDGGATWGDIVPVAEFDEATGCAPSDPAPVAVLKGDNAGEVVVLFRSCRTGAAPPGLVRSSDDGRTWSDPELLAVETADGRVPTSSVVPGPGHGVQLRFGSDTERLVASAWGELDGQREMFLLLSDDGGRSWRIGATTPPSADGTRRIDESAVTEATDGSILVSMRNPGESDPPGRSQARSVDGGETFELGDDGEALELHDELTVPIVQGSLATLVDLESIVLAAPSDPTARRGLRLWRSDDDGETWTEGPLVVPGPAAYSDLVPFLDGETLGVLVETGNREPYERIELIPVPLSRFEDEPEELPDDYVAGDAVSGRLVVDDDRLELRSICVGTDSVARITADGATVELDLSADAAAADVSVAVDGQGGALVVEGSAEIEREEGIAVRAELSGDDGDEHEVDLVLVNASARALEPQEDC